MAEPSNNPPSSNTPLTDQEKTILAGLIAKSGAEAFRSIPIATGFFGELSKAAGATGDALTRLGGVSEELTNSIQSVIKSFDVRNIGDSLNKFVKVLFTQVDAYQKLNQEFIKLGRGEDSKAYIESIRQQAFESQKLGLSLDDLININKKLLDSYTGATLILNRQTQEFKNNQKQITELIGFNNKFGVTQDETTRILNLFNVAMEGGSKGAQKLSDNLLIFAERTGQGPAKIFSEFNANIDRFSSLSSERAVASFQQLELAASRTGVKVLDVVKAVERFDDIEEGFKYGGQLNRVLSFMGGSFDTFKAMQATDEERATMLYQAIAQTGDRFQQLQTEQAKRAMVKQIQEASGLDPKVIVGLLNKSTNLASDIKELSLRPPVREEFTEEGRERAAMAATTSKELYKVQEAMFEYNSVVQKLSNVMEVNTERATRSIAVVAKNIDNSLNVASANIRNQESLNLVAKEYIEQIKSVPNAFKLAAAEFTKTTREPMEGVLSRNTTILTNLQTSIDAYNKNALQAVKVDVNVKSTPGTTAEVVATPTFGDAASGLPPMSRPPPQRPPVSPGSAKTP